MLYLIQRFSFNYNRQWLRKIKFCFNALVKRLPDTYSDESLLHEFQEFQEFITEYNRQNYLSVYSQ